MDTELVKGNVN